MQNQGRILRLIVLIISNSIILASVLAVMNFTYAQENLELHQKTLEYLSQKSTNPKQIAHIIVGNGPSAIAVDAYAHRVYVTNSGSNSVSVIDTTTNKNIKNIPVGRTPTAIAVDPVSNIVYVVNSGDNTVSVIDGFNDIKKKDIPVRLGSLPLDQLGRRISATNLLAVDPDSKIAYVANPGGSTVSVINATMHIRNISVGTDPIAIAVDPTFKRAYVANYDDSTVSVINGTTNIKNISVGTFPRAIAVGSFGLVYVDAHRPPAAFEIDPVHDKIITHMTVGGPVSSAIAVHSSPYNTLYVASAGWWKQNGNVSVINWTLASGKMNMKNITVGTEDPTAIAVDPDSNIAYVANSGGSSVSVINGTAGKKVVPDIPVGSHPEAIGVDQYTNTIYVTNTGDNTVSVIDGRTNKVVARVMFKTEPFNEGYIECGEDKLKAPILQQIYVWSGSECTAKPYQGFEFVSWQENLGGNSTQSINLVPPPSIVDSILDFLHMNPDKPEAKLNITRFGNFTANFKALPPPIPPEYVATLFTVVATALIGSWLTPTLIDRRKTRTQRKYFKECISQIGKLDKNALEDKIIGYYADGNLSDVQHQLLSNKISEYYGKEKSSE